MRLGDLSTPPAINRYVSEEPGVVRIRKSQLLYLAALTFGCMTAVFLIGLYAGRDQGVRAALAEYGGEVARIPVADPATTALAGSSTVSPDLGKPAPAANIANEAVAPPQVADMDFRPEAKVRAGDAAVEPAPPVEKSAEVATLKKSEAPEEPAKVEAVKPAVTSATGSWYIQAGAARSEKEALTYVRKFKAAGISAKVEKADVRGNRYFRIIVGPYTDKSAADKDLRKVANSKVLKSDPFVRLIKPN